MELEIIYEYRFSYSTVLLILPLLCFVALSFFLIIKAKKIFPKFTIKRQVFLFVFYMSFFVSLLMTILMVVKMPKIITNENQLKDALELKEYSVVEGEVKDYKLKEINNQYFESFQINNIKFIYSDNVNVNGLHQTSKRMGPIKSNGQYLRISYITRDSENLILKIEAHADRGH